MSADKFTEALFLAVNDFFSRAKEEVHQLGDVPGKLSQSIDEYWTIVWDSLSQQGRLPMPSLPSAIRPAPPPEPPSQWERITHQLSTHKYLVGGVGLVVSAVPAYYLCKRMYPQSFTAPPARPLCNGQIRLEAVLVLGADPGSPGFGLARDLAGRKNLIVLASVSSPADGQQLERGAGGWLKALVLDPTDIHGIPAFAQTLSSSLSMRFPLKSAGDPYVNTSRANSRSVLLTGVINALPLSAHFEPCPPVPLEATSLSTFINTLSGTVTTTLGVLQAVLPLLRNTTAAVTPSQHGAHVPPAVILTLVPAPTANVALPFVGGQSSADVALLNMLDALRRELRASETASSSSTSSGGTVSSRQVKFSTLDVGFFDPRHTASSSSHGGYPSELGVSADDVPPHLAFYLPAMARRTLVSRYHGGSKPPQPSQAHFACLQPAPLAALTDKVAESVLRPSKIFNNSRSSIGKTSWAYRLARYLPNLWVDYYFTLQDHITSFLPAPQLLSGGMRTHRAEARSWRLRKPLPASPPRPPNSTAPNSTSIVRGSAASSSSEEERASMSSDSEPEHGGEVGSGGRGDGAGARTAMTSSVASLVSLQSDEGHSSQASAVSSGGEETHLGQSEYVRL